MTFGYKGQISQNKNCYLFSFAQDRPAYRSFVSNIINYINSVKQTSISQCGSKINQANALNDQYNGKILLEFTNITNNYIFGGYSGYLVNSFSSDSKVSFVNVHENYQKTHYIAFHHGIPNQLFNVVSSNYIGNQNGYLIHSECTLVLTGCNIINNSCTKTFYCHKHSSSITLNQCYSDKTDYEYQIPIFQNSILYNFIAEFNIIETCMDGLYYHGECVTGCYLYENGFTEIVLIFLLT